MCLSVEITREAAVKLAKSLTLAKAAHVNRKPEDMKEWLGNAAKEFEVIKANFDGVYHKDGTIDYDALYNSIIGE